MTDGYIKLWRKSLDGDMLKNHKLWVFWTWCLMKASHKVHKITIGFQEIELLPGQFVFGRKKASKELKMSERNIRTFLNFLKTYQKLTIKATNKYSVLTIINWERYQGNGNENDHQNDQSATSKRPASDHKQERKEGKEEEKEIDTIVSTKKCSEDKNVSEQNEVEKVFITLTLNDKSEYPIAETVIAEMQELYPAVNIEQEFRTMRGWLGSNPVKRKTKRGIKKFYNNWLSRKQDKGGSIMPAKPINDPEPVFISSGPAYIGLTPEEIEEERQREKNSRINGQ